LREGRERIGIATGRDAKAPLQRPRRQQKIRDARGSAEHDERIDDPEFGGSM